MSDPHLALARGAAFPYDGGEAFWNDRADTPPPAKDWAHAAARGVLADLSDRCGINHELAGVDHEVREELTASLAAIIREAEVARWQNWYKGDTITVTKPLRDHPRLLGDVSEGITPMFTAPYDRAVGDLYEGE